MSPTSWGRPETTSTTHFIAAHTLCTAAVSAAVSSRSLPLPTSPTPSAYGVSPTTTTPTSYPDRDADASLEYVTCPPAFRMPWRIVVPSVMSPEEPCQVMVQPPVWLPRSSALEPAT